MKKVNKKHSILVKIMTVAFFALIGNGYLFAAPVVNPINQDDLIYFIMTDRFNDGDPANNQNVRKNDPAAYHGGDFQGVIDKLDYIKGMGFTTIWISPVVANQMMGYHGYWATDFYKTNEHFGSVEKLKELVVQAHEKGLKVILDLVVNHTGALHPWAGDPNYQSWFHHQGTIRNFNDQREVENGRVAGLPDFDQDNPEVRHYLIEMAKWWIRETGVDGYRLDTVKHVPPRFWLEFSAEIKREFPGFFLMGEVFDARPSYVGDYQKTGIDGLVDFPIYYAVNEVFGGYVPATRLSDTVHQCAMAYPNASLMGTFIDNHDVPRFINQASSLPMERLKEVLVFEMTYTGIPVVYYGTEIGMDGGADPDNRRDMDWSINSPLTGYLKTLTRMRKENPALTRGVFRVVKTERNFLCYLRKAEENIVLAVFNLSDRQNVFEFSLPGDLGLPDGVWTELTGMKPLTTFKGNMRVKMAPRQAMVFRFDNSPRSD